MRRGNIVVRASTVILLVLIAAHGTRADQYAQSRQSRPDKKNLALKENKSGLPLQFFRLSPIERYSPIWQELVHHLHEELENSLWTQDLIESSFAFDADMLRQYRDGILAPEFQIADLASILLGSGETKFKLTKQALHDLKDEGFSDKILTYLEQLLDQEFFEEQEFLAAVEDQIGEKTTLQYEKQLLEYALVEDLLLLKTPLKSRQDAVLAEYALKESIAAWDRALYYPRKLKEIFSIDEDERPQERYVPPSVPFNESDIHFKLRQFFKEWGLPRPRTVLLWGIAIYLLIALIVRLKLWL